MKKPYIYFFVFFLLTSCSSKEEEIYTPVPYSLEIPALFADKLIAPIIPADNLLTEEGVALGKKLFFDKKLIGRQHQSLCSSCHSPKKAFTDQQQFSTGVQGEFGDKKCNAFI